MSLILDIKSFYIRYALYIFVFLIPLVIAFRGSYIFYKGDTRVDFYNLINNSNTISYPVIYEYDDLALILKESPVETYTKGFDKIRDYPSGLLVLTDADTTDISNYNLNLIYSISNTLKRGPNILIYTFEK